MFDVSFRKSAPLCSVAIASNWCFHGNVFNPGCAPTIHESWTLMTARVPKQEILSRHAQSVSIKIESNEHIAMEQYQIDLINQYLASPAAFQTVHRQILERLPNQTQCTEHHPRECPLHLPELSAQSKAELWSDYLRHLARLHYWNVSPYGLPQFDIGRWIEKGSIPYVGAVHASTLLY